MSKFKKEYFAEILKLQPGDPNYNIFRNQAQEDVLFTNFAYEQDSEYQAMQEIASKLPSNNYQLLLMTDHVFDTDKYSYRCAVFIDNENKEIVFANAGTRLKLDKRVVHDLIDDSMLILQKQPFKVRQAAILNDMILDSLGDQAGEFKFHYTGHSLGAAVAEMAAVDMDIKLTQRGKEQGKELNKDQVSSVTFENPGTKPMVKKMYEKAGLENNVENLQFSAINNRDNIINTLNNQIGKPYEIIPSKQKERNPNSLQLFAAYLSKKICSLSKTKVGRIVGKVVRLLAPGTLSLANEHVISNFNDTFVKKMGIVRKKGNEVITIDEATTGYKSIEYDQDIFQELQEMKQQNDNIHSQEYIMNYVDTDSLVIKSVTCSKLELQQAVQKIDRQHLPDKKEKKSFTQQFLSKKAVIEQGSKEQNYKKPTAREIIPNQHSRG